MKGFQRTLLAGLLICNNAMSFADAATCEATTCLPSIYKALYSLVNHLGYNIDPLPSNVSSALINLALTTNAEQNVVSTQLGALPVVAMNPNGSGVLYSLVPSATTNAETLNQRLNATFSYLSKSSNNTPALISVTQNAQTDQQPYQYDPVTQVLLNSLVTPPNQSNCPAAGQGQPPCLPLQTIKDSTLTIATPLTNSYNTSTVFPLLPTVNFNTLMTPLLITPTASTNTPSSLYSSSSVTVAQANTFIRYVSNTMVPLTLPDYAQISQTYKDTPANRSAIQAYLANQRAYAAQLSVGLSNLYYILSKRLPQADAQGNQTSQALDEFNMATWRLFPPKSASADQQWVTAIAEASPAALQKEMLTLLAEMNYQLYLNRQEQERSLATLSVLLLVSSKTAQPDVAGLSAVFGVTSNPSPTPPPK